MSIETPVQVWGVAVLAPTQEVAANKHCFGDCGKISMGGIIHDDLTGGLFVCPESECQYEERVIEGYGTTMSFERHHTIHLRLLKEEAHDSAVLAKIEGSES